MPRIYISVRPYPDQELEKQRHNLSNIIDDIWKDKIVVERSDFISERLLATVALLDGRMLRKKEKDELNRRIVELGKQHPFLEPEVHYSKEDL